MTETSRNARIKKLEAQLINRQIDRRGFLMGATALGLSVSAAGVLADKAAAATPKTGGLFRAAASQGQTTDTLDPAKFNNQYQILVSYTLRNNLTELSSADELRGELAETWEASEDATTWVFNLRKGVEFHNGKTFDSADAAASLQHHLGEESTSAAKGLLSSIEEIKVDGPNRIIVSLSGGNADFPTLLTDYHMPMMPSDGEGNVDWASGNGTGGYRMESFEPGVTMQVKRFPNYWKEDSAYFDEASLHVISDVVARTSALVSGSLDAIDSCDLKTVDRLQEDTSVAVEEVPTAAHATIPMITTKAPFDNKDVRLAVKYAIDRQEILDKILNGFGTLGNDHPVGSRVPFHASELPQRMYDPDKVKFHLKKAGLNGLDITLHTSEQPFTGAVDTAILYQSSAKAAGINLEVARHPSDGYWDNIWLKMPFTVSNWGARPTADMIFSTVYAADAPWNETFWKNERFNTLLVAARSELDPAKRREMYVEMQSLCRDDGGAVIPFFKNFVYARSNTVQRGPSIGSTWELDGFKAVERWWFA